MKNIFTLAILTTIIFASCDIDNGPILREDIPVAFFDRLEIKADVDVFITQDSWVGVVAEGPSESLSNLEFEVKNGKLTIRDLGRISRLTEVRIHVPYLERIEHDCHGDIYGQNFFSIDGKMEIVSTKQGNIDLAIIADEIEVRHRGDGEITIEGETNFLDLKVNDSGHFLGFKLYADDAKVKLTDDGFAEIQVGYDLDATINGNGDIFLIGFPDISLNKNGAGELIDVN